ncbi:MAG: hypothetical protein QOK40_2059 [Miltoncostaeaceae bacterium]|nr:hypothetical protein [Miltoncostaeaceae bacterium]
MTIAPLRGERRGAPRWRGAVRTRAIDGPLAATWAMIALWAAALGWLSVARYRAFGTGRFDLGNMVQAIWSTAHGHLLSTTDIAGGQFSRLGAHVDPILAVFAPIFRLWPSPALLLVAQAAIVALGALPAFWLARRWLVEGWIALAGPAAYLLYPPVQWATVTEFHAVTLAAPLLMFCIWAAEERRPFALAAFAALALLCKEEVGLALVGLGLWMAFRGARRAGLALAAGSAAWVAIAVWVIIPHFNGGRPSAFIARYGDLGASEGAIVRTLLTRPWEAVQTVATYGRLSYLLALLLPLLLLPLLAPALAACALPELALNLLADWWPQRSIEFQYVAVPSPFLVAAAILGLARLTGARDARARPRGRPLGARLGRLLGWPAAGPAAAVLAVALLLAGIRLGPMPWWSGLPLASQSRVHQYERTAHTAALEGAVDLVPAGVPVSAGNHLGSHLSARARILTFPVIAEARYVLVDRRQPDIGFVPQAQEHERRVRALMARPDFRLIYERDGVLVFRRVPRT